MRTVKINEDRSIEFGGQATNVTWTREAASDLLRFHGLDIADEVSKAIVAELHNQYNLTKEEKVTALRDVKEHLNQF